MSSKQTSGKDSRRRDHGHSEKVKEKDRGREKEKDKRGRTLKIQPPEQRPKNRPSSVDDKKPRNPSPPPRPSNPNPDPPPPAQPPASSSSAALSDPTEVRDGRHEAASSAVPKANWAYVEVLGESTTAIFDFDIEDNFISENFATSRLRTEGRSVKGKHAYYNTPLAKKRIKTSIKFLDGGVLKDETLYIVEGDMPNGLTIVLGRESASRFEPMPAAVEAKAKYPSSQYQSPSASSIAPSSKRLHTRTISQETNSSVSSSYNSEYTYRNRNPRDGRHETSEVQYYKPASPGDRGEYPSQRNQSVDSEQYLAEECGHPWEEHPREQDGVPANLQQLSYGQEDEYATSETPTEEAHYSENNSYETQQTWQQTPRQLRGDIYE